MQTDILTPQERRHYFFRNLKAYGISVSPVSPLIDMRMFDAMSEAHLRAYVMTWENPMLAGDATWDTDPADFISEEAQKGSEFFAEVWTEYCRLFMEGRIQSMRGKPDKHE